MSWKKQRIKTLIAFIANPSGGLHTHEVHAHVYTPLQIVR